MHNFIEGVKEKRRQKDIMIKASEIEMRGMNFKDGNNNGRD